MTVTISGSTGIATPDGSASVPPYTGSSGATNGLYFPSATSMALASNGSVALTIDSSQRVGIGAAAATRPFSVSSTEYNLVSFLSSGAETNIQIQNTSTNGRNWSVIAGGSGGALAGGLFGIYDTTASAVRLAIDSNGNVGLGTTSPGTIKLKISTNTSGYALQTVGTVNDYYGMSIYNASSGSSARAYLQIGNDSSQYQTFISCNSSTNTDFGGANALNIVQGGAAPIAFATSNTLKMLIDSAGNTLIGSGTASGAVYDTNGGADVSFAYRLQSSNGSAYARAVMGNNNNTGIGLFATTCYNSSGNQVIVSLIKGEADSLTAGSETGFLSFHTKPSGSFAYNTERARITNAGYLLVNRTGNSNFPAYISSRNNGSNIGAVYAESSATNYFALGALGNNASYADYVILTDCTRAQTTAYYFLSCRSSSGTDVEFALRGDGNGYADGTWNNNGADYAEYFESATGTALTVGASVVLDGSKVREATDQDLVSNIIGVVRPKEPSKASMVVGNTAWNKWTDRYLTDDFDRYIMEDHEAVDWVDETGESHSYESHAIPEGIVVPENAERKTHDSKGNKLQHYKSNPAYDPNLEYTPRENRPEWIIVGLMGQVKILKGQPVNDRWVKMRDVSSTVEEWMIR